MPPSLIIMAQSSGKNFHDPSFYMALRTYEFLVSYMLPQELPTPPLSKVIR